MHISLAQIYWTLKLRTTTSSQRHPAREETGWKEQNLSTAKIKSLGAAKAWIWMWALPLSSMTLEISSKHVTYNLWQTDQHFLAYKKGLCELLSSAIHVLHLPIFRKEPSIGPCEIMTLAFSARRKKYGMNKDFNRESSLPQRQMKNYIVSQSKLVVWFFMYFLLKTCSHLVAWKIIVFL